MLGVLALNLVLWLVAPPINDGRPDFTRQVFSEFLAATTVLCFTVCLVLATRWRVLEPWFGGLDRMYRVHREAAVVGFVLLVAHVALVPWRLDSPGGTPSGLIAFAGILVLVLLSIGPRLPVLRRVMALSYHRWRWTHRYIGFFFIVSLAHMLLVDAAVHSASAPFALLMTAYVVGAVAFAYSMLLARFMRPRRRYVVEGVRPVATGVVEVALRARKAGRAPLGAVRVCPVRAARVARTTPVHHFQRPGWVNSAVDDQGTRRLHRSARRHAATGTAAVVEGGYGLFDYRTGAARQVWVAGGIGVTPFLAWLRDEPETVPREIALFCVVRLREDALFADELHTAHERHPGLSIHLHVSSESGTFTVDRIAEKTGGLDRCEVYLCGPRPMVDALERGFRQHGVDRTAIHFEEFAFR
ncbi:ferric reductase-like transmembrane domain-containing protein [Microlunatus parietis]